MSISTAPKRYTNSFPTIWTISGPASSRGCSSGDIQDTSSDDEMESREPPTPASTPPRATTPQTQSSESTFQPTQGRNYNTFFPNSWSLNPGAPSIMSSAPTLQRENAFGRFNTTIQFPSRPLYSNTAIHARRGMRTLINGVGELDGTAPPKLPASTVKESHSTNYHTPPVGSWSNSTESRGCAPPRPPVSGSRNSYSANINTRPPSPPQRLVDTSPETFLAKAVVAHALRSGGSSEETYGPAPPVQPEGAPTGNYSADVGTVAPQVQAPDIPGRSYSGDTWSAAPALAPKGISTGKYSAADSNGSFSVPQLISHKRVTTQMPSQGPLVVDKKAENRHDAKKIPKMFHNIWGKLFEDDSKDQQKLVNSPNPIETAGYREQRYSELQSEGDPSSWPSRPPPRAAMPRQMGQSYPVDPQHGSKFSTSSSGDVIIPWRSIL